MSSTTPARDAINRLTSEGALVYTGPKTVVVPNSPAADLREITLTRLALRAGFRTGRPAGNAGRRGRLWPTRAYQFALDENRYAEARGTTRNSTLRSTVSRVFPSSFRESKLWLRIGPSLHNLYPELPRRIRCSQPRDRMEALAERDAASLRAAMEKMIFAMDIDG